MIIGVVPINRSPEILYRTYGCLDRVNISATSNKRRGHYAPFSYGTEIAIPTYRNPSSIIYNNDAIYKLISVQHTKLGPIYYEYVVYKKGNKCYPFKVKVLYDQTDNPTYARSFVLTNNLHEVHADVNEYMQYFKTPARSLVEDMLSFYQISNDHKNDIAAAFNQNGLYLENVAENTDTWSRDLRDILALDLDRSYPNDKWMRHLIAERLNSMLPVSDSVMTKCFSTDLSLAGLESLGDRCYGIDLNSTNALDFNRDTTLFGACEHHFSKHFEQSIYSDMIIEYILSNGVEVSDQSVSVYTRYNFQNVDKECSGWEISAVCAEVTGSVAERWPYYQADGDVGADDDIKVKITKTFNDEVYLEVRNVNTNKVIMSQHIDLILDGLCSRGIVWPIGY